MQSLSLEASAGYFKEIHSGSMKFLREAAEWQISNRLAPLQLRRVCFNVLGMLTRHHKCVSLVQYCIDWVTFDTDFVIQFLDYLFRDAEMIEEFERLGGYDAVVGLQGARVDKFID